MSLRAPSLRKRSRTFDATDGAADEDDINQKGGHSLRKRQRIDYSIDAHEDEASSNGAAAAAAAVITTPTTTTVATIVGAAAANANANVAGTPKTTLSTRARKRRTDPEDDPDDFSTTPARRRQTERDLAGTDSSPGRRKNPARRGATETKVYVEDDVKDTIEVGIAYDDSDESHDAQSGNSSAFQESSPEDVAAPSSRPSTPVPASRSRIYTNSHHHSHPVPGQDHVPVVAHHTRDAATPSSPVSPGIRARDHAVAAAPSTPTRPAPAVPAPEHKIIRIKLVKSSAAANSANDDKPQVSGASEQSQGSGAQVSATSVHQPKVVEEASKQVATPSMPEPGPRSCCRRAGYFPFEIASSGRLHISRRTCTRQRSDLAAGRCRRRPPPDCQPGCRQDTR